MKGRPVLLAIGIAILVAFVSFGARWQLDSRLWIPEQDRWVATDPDGLYHLRRLDRVAREGLPVASRDPLLSYPEGSMIPWPPYYTMVAWAVLGPFVPSGDQARELFLEEAASSLACVFGVLASLLAAAAAGLLAGPFAALCAGLLHALCFGSIAYSRLGIGDHHAFVSWVSGAMLLAASAAFARGALERPRVAMRHGLLSGALAGLLLGSWVASLLDVVLFEIVLAVLIFVHARRRLPGLAAYGLTYHLAALAVLTPALLASPWRVEHPWMVVNLSWYHAAHLLLGALVFVPLALRPENDRLRGRYPWIVGASLIALGAILIVLPFGPGAGIREGFAWIGRENRFMATVTESRPLIGAAAGEGAPLFYYLGWAVLLLPLVWLLALHQVWTERRLALLPWLVVVPPMLLQALAQRRFADALALPQAVMLGWGLAQVLPGRASLARLSRLTAGLPRAIVGPALVLGVVGSSWGAVVQPIGAQVLGGERPALTPAKVRSIGMRLALEWLREHSPEDGEYSVLAQWANGHAIEWVAARPTVATNFGTYVGAESFLDALRFLLTEDETEAEAILEAHRARYVVLESEWPSYASIAIRTAFPDLWSRYYDAPLGGKGAVRDAFFDTLGARLLFGGMRAKAGPETSGLGFLRLVHLSPVPDPQPVLRGWSERWPSTFVYERVLGAKLEVEAPAGTRLGVEIPLRFPLPGGPYTWLWRAHTLAGQDGRARLRIPYPTLNPGPESTAGAGVTAGPATWHLGDRSGRLEIREEDVLAGRTMALAPAR